MPKKVLTAIAMILFMPWTIYAQDAKIVLENAAKAMGVANLKSVQYSGSGYNFAVGQSPNPGAPWPKFNVKNYTRVVNYETISSREELIRTQGENPPRGGGGQPLAGEQRQVLLVSGNQAWNMTGENVVPAPTALDERLLQIWVTPHGLIKAALANNATVKSTMLSQGQAVDPSLVGAAASTATIKSPKMAGKKVTAVSFLVQGKFKVNGFINDQNLVEKVETWVGNPVLGDVLIETIYSNYQDLKGVKFPTQILQKQGGFPSLDITVTDVQPNAAAEIRVPDSLRAATSSAVRVEVNKLADGVWYLSGGSHHSVAVEFKDYVAVIEGPLNEDRSLAVITEVKKTIPNKPIKYLVNTHHHFDHSGGIRTYAAEGATIITHQINKSFYERAFQAPWTLNPDKLAQSKKKPKIESLTDKHLLADGTRTLELHHIKGNSHHDGIIMAYLPKEKLLVEADVFTPSPPNAPPPTSANLFSLNLYENIQRLKLDVDQIAPLHGRVVRMEDLLKAIGKGP